ncbi:HAMP domain-containing sensor histidine kinase [Rapidithrix thailandica]|uniref:histidine kinase n=1 Tax=Rapidithrix thailandica TaxID=413964 RepID=A0AAW9SCM7_9BACT
MKLLNHTLLYLSVALLPVIGIWAAIFYLNMMDEVYDSIDDGLENHKMLVIRRAMEDTTVLQNDRFGSNNFALRKLPKSSAITVKDTYKDTLMYMENEEDFEPVRMLTTVFYRPGQGYYQLKVITSMVEEDDLIEDLLYSLFWLYVVLLASVLVVNNFLLRKIWKPFYHLLHYLKGFRLENKPVVKPVSTKVKEFQDLNEAVVSLLERNIEVFNSQKQFIENASHELQTPLAISLNKLELLLEEMQGEEKQAQTIGQVMATLEKLTRLNKSLLLLSKIENRQFPEEEPVHFHQLAYRLTEDFADLAGFKELRLSYIEEAPLSVTMNKDLAEILLTNLLKNAIVHNYAGGQVTVKVCAYALRIENTGKSEALDAQKAFGRFYKNSSQNASTGLGLAIAKAIADVYGISLRYHYDEKHILSLEF